MKIPAKLLQSSFPIIIVIQCLLPLIARAQDTSVNFITAKDWQEVLTMAKQKHKPIFIDAMATWCAPCIKMDQEVYTTKNIAKYMNANFIAVKVQMDKTAKDNDIVKGWYADAKMLMEKYHLEAFPTFLYVDQNGNLLHRESGYQSAEQFIALSKTAIDTNANYAHQIEQFRVGKLVPSELLDLALKTKKYKEDSLAFQIAEVYRYTYIDKQDPSKLLRPEHVAFFVHFYKLFNVNDPIIKYLYKHSNEADKALRKQGFSKVLTDQLIMDYYIINRLWPNKKMAKIVPKWKKLENEITKNYNTSTAKNLVLNAKLRWYTEKKDWNKVIALNIEKVEFEGIDTLNSMAKVGINNMVYDVIFMHSTKKEELLKGIEYMEVLLKNEPNAYFWIDTYASLLYKYGNKLEAIKQQEKAIALARKVNDKTSIELYLTNIKKMKNNEPTWY